MIPMKKTVLFSFLAAAGLSLSFSCSAQKVTETITAAEVKRIETVLASDSFAGRAVGTPGIQMAADFIAAEFRKAGLQPVQGTSFLQAFVMVKPQQTSLQYSAEGTTMDAKNVIVFTSKEKLEVTEKSGYAVENINRGDAFFNKAMAAAQAQKNTLVLVDTSFARNFVRLTGLKRQLFQSPHSVVFVLGNALPKTFTISALHTFQETKLANVVGILPGKSKKAEQVIFSAHYDHIGIGRPVDGDSIYNGANDDAAGTTAVILLANHFKKLGNNERTLVFAAFTAEESGGFGAQYFSRQFNPDGVAAMFNIEMIGTESKWGKNSAYITGFEKTSMGEILQAALKGSQFTFHPDPYPDQQLFYRSDNATLARLGVPAHTISTSKMDSEPNYHKPSDEVSTLDLENMAQIIKAIAESSKTIISGKETPTRVKEESLR